MHPHSMRDHQHPLSFPCYEISNSLSIKMNFLSLSLAVLLCLFWMQLEQIIFAFSNTCSFYFKPISLPLLFFSRFIIAGAELSMLSHGVSILFSNFMNKKKADVRNFLQCLFLLELQSPTSLFNSTAL